MISSVNPFIAIGVIASTAATDSAYVFFNAAVSGRRRVSAANWSAIWYLLSAFAGHQLYGKCSVCAVRRAGLVARRVCFSDMARPRPRCRHEGAP